MGIFEITNVSVNDAKIESAQGINISAKILSGSVIFDKS